MRGKHRKFIDEVNAQFDPFYIQEGRGKYRTIRPLVFDTVAGPFAVKSGTETDLFSKVSNTGYIRFHMAAVFHDEARKKYNRVLSDFMFLVEMVAAIKDIRAAFLNTTCPKKVIDKECFRLARVASLYMLGVSGLIGSLYIKLDKWF